MIYSFSEREKRKKRRKKRSIACFISEEKPCSASNQKPKTMVSGNCLGKILVLGAGVQILAVEFQGWPLREKGRGALYQIQPVPMDPPQGIAEPLSQASDTSETAYSRKVIKHHAEREVNKKA